MRQKSLTNEECIRRFKNIHGNKYDYSRFNHISLKTKGEIICPFHGHFFQTTGGHLNGKGCRLCGYLTISKKLSSNKSSFIMKANIIHKNIYDYSKVNYINNRIKVEIISPIHGSFFQTPNNHLNGNKCLKCQPERISISLRKNNVEAINDFKIIHGNIYDYSKTKYGKNQKTKVEIICKKHGATCSSSSTCRPTRAAIRPVPAPHAAERRRGARGAVQHRRLRLPARALLALHRHPRRDVRAHDDRRARLHREARRLDGGVRPRPRAPEAARARAASAAEADHRPEHPVARQFAPAPRRRHRRSHEALRARGVRPHPPISFKVAV